MDVANIYIFLIALLISYITAVNAEDMPCSPKRFPNRSVVCVCNSSYCDKITREIPECGYAINYASSEGGLRFKKTVLRFESCDTEPLQSSDTITLVINPSVTHQSIEGFGGAVTDSAAMNWKRLSDSKAQQHLINSYCGSSGIQYNMIRVPMGASDFSTRLYTYDDLQGNDTTLKNFALQPEDVYYKIPMIKACMKAAKTTVKVIGSCWSPPTRMKTTHKFTGLTRLLDEFYQPFANYYLKFVQEYNKAKVPIWAVTTGNEPLNGIAGFGGLNDLGWTISGMCKWVRDYLSPTLRNNSDVKILAVDDQRFTIPLWITMVARQCAGYMKAFDGVGLHYYFDETVPVSIIHESLKDYPNLFLINTEACTGVQTTPSVDLGSWDRAETYIRNMFEDLNNKFVAWVDWNMCLSMTGGPNWENNFVDSPIIVNAEKNEFYKQPMFYAIGHFSKFIPRHSVRIDVRDPSKCPEAPPSILNVAFKTPQNTIVVVIYNRENMTKSVILKLGNRQISLDVGPKTIITVEMHNE
ncbi:hypothetical protein K1T71_011155 [Dendrolimus kikuchii]|uniref:Uncharacterized protein n=1 Tax=Dendrolimus kikuchii TaxID=765133 RepID=A0ACC1CN11_9NEOP|nr:hypothetical protein K1T71_011155 [Dendrolimus kikuchii]